MLNVVIISPQVFSDGLMDVIFENKYGKILDINQDIFQTIANRVNLYHEDPILFLERDNNRNNFNLYYEALIDMPLIADYIYSSSKIININVITDCYYFIRYLEVLRQSYDDIIYTSIYQDDSDKHCDIYEQNFSFKKLTQNWILKEHLNLLKLEITKICETNNYQRED